ncbi:hypothetical protein ACN42_g732 [Penicillium freii]|uniref:Uncharacterized protein n=1 Tax=Penicillium freii TaxID=48697 RepID=A0A124GT36_PENFR|nr:hypothetical protein ACN42_g732 [Penicillium freii]
MTFKLHIVLGIFCLLVSYHALYIYIYIYRSLDYLSITLRYSGLFGLVCNSLVQGQVITVRGACCNPKYRTAKGKEGRNYRLSYATKARWRANILNLKGECINRICTFSVELCSFPGLAGS